MSDGVDTVHPGSRAPEVPAGLVSVSFGVDPVFRVGLRHNNPAGPVCVASDFEPVLWATRSPENPTQI